MDRGCDGHHSPGSPQVLATTPPLPRNRAVGNPRCLEETEGSHFNANVYGIFYQSPCSCLLWPSVRSVHSVCPRGPLVPLCWSSHSGSLRGPTFLVGSPWSLRLWLASGVWLVAVSPLGFEVVSLRHPLSLRVFSQGLVGQLPQCRHPPTGRAPLNALAPNPATVPGPLVSTRREQRDLGFRCLSAGGPFTCRRGGRRTGSCLVSGASGSRLSICSKRVRWAGTGWGRIRLRSR